MKIIRSSIFAAVLAGVVAFASVPPARAADSDDTQTAMTTAMGTFIAQGLLMTYVSIGTTSDAYTKKAYKPEEATEVLDTCQRTMKVAQAALKKLVDSGAISGASDVKYCNDSIAAYEDLNEEAALVKTCIKDMSQPNIKRFLAKKDEAWKKITALIE